MWGCAAGWPTLLTDLSLCQLCSVLYAHLKLVPKTSSLQRYLLCLVGDSGVSRSNSFFLSLLVFPNVPICCWLNIFLKHFLFSVGDFANFKTLALT